MVYHSTFSDDCFWYMILSGKQKRKKTKTHPNTKFFPIFNGRNNNERFLKIEKFETSLVRCCS